MNRYPADIYLLKVNNKRLEQGVAWRCKDVFIVNFEYISHLVPVFLLLAQLLDGQILNRQILSGYKNDFYFLNKNLMVMLFSKQLNYYTTIEKVLQVLQYFAKAVLLRRARSFCSALFKRIFAWKRGISKR